MADNLDVTPGTGATVAADDIAGVLYQRVKLAQGADGSATDVSSAAPLQVTLANGTVPSHAVTNAGTFAVQAVCTNAGTFATQSVCTNAGTFAVQAAQSGTWTIDLGATDNAVLDAIAASLAGTLTVGSHAVTNAGTFAVQAVCTNAGTFAVQAVCTNAGTFAVQVDGSALTSLQLIDDTVYTDDAAFTPGTSKVLGVGFEADEGSTDSVDEGDIGAARMTLDRKQIVTVQPHTAGGLSTFRSLDLDETEEEIKGSAGSIYKLRISNFSTSIRYVKLYNAAAASVTVGSTTPLDTIVVPGATSATQPTVITESYGGVGWMFDTGICAAATTALADADTGAPGANEIVLTAYYK